VHDNPSAPQLLTDDLLGKLADMQHELDLLRQQLSESQRLATIGQIAAVIAHEFNNLLTPIVSYSQFALNGINAEKPDMEIIKKALTKAFASSEKAGKICTSMLSLARGESEFSSFSVQNSSMKPSTSLPAIRARTGSRCAFRFSPIFRHAAISSSWNKCC